MPQFSDRPPVAVQEITSLEALEALGSQWQQLWRQDRSATPFQSPAWLGSWWRHIGQGELWTQALRATSPAGQAGRLVGLLPMYIYRKPGSALRELFPLGLATTDYLDGLFAPGWERCAAAAALAHLDAHRDRWDVCDLQQLRPTSPLLSVALPEGWTEQICDGEPCLTLALPASVEELPACVPAHMLQNLRYRQNRAQRLGEARIERADRGNWEELYQALLKLHRARWQRRRQDGVLADEGVQQAHRQALPGLLAQDVLRLYALRLDGGIVAVLYCLVDGRPSGGRLYHYISGFDPQFDRLSPGTLLTGHAMKEAIGEGIATFDFLRGAEPYKYLWGAKESTTRRRRLMHPGASLALAHGGLESFELALKVRIRPCVKHDLPTLEWFGLFSAQRGIIEATFERHQRGEAIMLVAEANGVPSAQIWIDLDRKDLDSTGVLWALRVFPTLQNRGVGSRLMAAAEQILRQRGFGWAELTVEKDNSAALRLYERLGYRLVGEARAGSIRTAPDDSPASGENHQWVMRKPLAPEAPPRQRQAHPGEEGRTHENAKDRPALDAGRCEPTRI